MTPNEPGLTTYSFGPFRLLPQRQLLLREGVPVPIGGRALDILTLLVRRAGEVVGKDDLLAFCWPSTFVHESNVKVNLAALRKVLADEPTARYIATVAGRGYRFVAPVEVTQSAAGAPARGIAQPKPLLKSNDVIGRAEEIDCLAGILAGSRCVTIVGPGGVGKTTIALAVAHNVQGSYPDGVYFIDLSTVGDAQYATAAIAAGVGARQRSEDTLSEIIDLLHERRMLLILDNCEHLAPTVSAIVDRMLECLPTITVLATSRENLRVAPEQVHRLPSLAVPDPDHGAIATEALEFGAVRLFVARANERGRYELSDADAPLVSAICRRLDGIPLAIELAASKVFTFGVPTLLAMLEQKFLVLSNANRTAPLRQQTLLTTLDWSYRLLSDDEAALLRHLSVFAGAFLLPDAVAMAEAAGLNATQTIEALERLASRSLVGADYRNGALTYRLLESTRAYAADRLQDAGERPRAMQQYAVHIVTLYERAAEELESRDKHDWMADYAERIYDLRNAMTWAFSANGDRMIGIRLTAAAIPLWYELSSLSEMQSRVERALLAAQDLGDCSKALTMKLTAARASGMTFAQHLPLATEAAWRECYELGVESDSVKYQIFGLWGLAAYLIYIGKPLEGLECLERFGAIAEAQSDWTAVDEGHRMTATAEIYIGKIARARDRLERLAARHQRRSDPVRFARFQAERGVAIRCSLALALWVSGEPSRALHLARAAVERAETSGHVVSHTNALAVFAVPIAFWSGDYEAARRFLDAVADNRRREDIGVWREWCQFYDCAVRAKLGERGAAAELKERLGALIAARQYLRAPMHCSMVADALVDVGAIDAARTIIDQANSLATAQAAKWCLPEILRVTALVEWRSGNAADAHRLIRRAISEAATIEARTLELRAAVTFATEVEAKCSFDEAADLLGEICARFRSDDAYPDLKRARARLRQMRAVNETLCS